MKKAVVNFFLLFYNAWAILFFCVFIITTFPFALIFSWTMGRKSLYPILSIYRGWSRVYALGTGLRIKHFGKENIKKDTPYVFAGNHSNFIDMFAVAGSLNKAYKPIAKKELLKIPFLGTLFRVTCIMVDRKSEESRKQTVENMRKEVNSGVSIVVFPEGTRNKVSDKILLPFKDGAFRIAFDTGADLLPFVILGAKKLMKPKGFWMRPGKVEIHYLQPISTKGFNSPDEMKEYTFNLIENFMLKNSGN